ncbi:MAG: hypothetical protein ACI4IS_03325 [Acutalibacteraceae bacterium]
MNKSTVKYISVAALAVLLTVSVIFTPYVYYAVSDAKILANSQVEEFSLQRAGEKSTLEEKIALITSEKAIWVNEALEQDDVKPTVLRAVRNMGNYLCDEYTKNVLSTFLDSEDITLTYFESTIASGPVNGEPVYVPLLYAEFYGDNFPAATVLVDRYTNKVYQFTITANEKTFYTKESEDAFYSGLNIPEDDYYEIMHSVYKQLLDYFSNLSLPRVSITARRESFKFSVFGFNYLYHKYDIEDDLANDTHNYYDNSQSEELS